jgi:hypothetical protein
MMKDLYTCSLYIQFTLYISILYIANIKYNFLQIQLFQKYFSEFCSTWKKASLKIMAPVIKQLYRRHYAAKKICARSLLNYSTLL